jgi:hypothetical protein
MVDPFLAIGSQIQYPSSLHGNTKFTATTMRVASTPDFNGFLMANAAVFPYSKLRPTRSSFFCKWVMLQGTDRGSTEYLPVLANSLPNGVICELISSGRAKPFTPELSDIMDAMYWWGKNKNVEWYEEVVVMLDEALDAEYDRKELFRALILGQVKVSIHEYFGVNSMAGCRAVVAQLDQLVQWSLPVCAADIFGNVIVLLRLYQLEHCASELPCTNASATRYPNRQRGH